MTYFVPVISPYCRWSHDNIPVINKMYTNMAKISRDLNKYISREPKFWRFFWRKFNSIVVLKKLLMLAKNPCVGFMIMMFSWISHKDFVLSQVVSSKLQRNHGASIFSIKNCPQNDLIFSWFLGKNLIFLEDSEIQFNFWFFLFYCIDTYFHFFNEKIGISWKNAIFFVLKKSTFSYIISTKMEKFGL